MTRTIFAILADLDPSKYMSKTLSVAAAERLVREAYEAGQEDHMLSAADEGDILCLKVRMSLTEIAHFKGDPAGIMLDKIKKHIDAATPHKPIGS